MRRVVARGQQPALFRPKWPSDRGRRRQRARSAAVKWARQPEPNSPGQAVAIKGGGTRVDARNQSPVDQRAFGAAQRLGASVLAVQRDPNAR